MKVDLYTKFVLTIIAVALSAIAIKGYPPTAAAQVDSIQKVSICSLDGENCAYVNDEYAIRVLRRADD